MESEDQTRSRYPTDPIHQNLSSAHITRPEDSQHEPTRDLKYHAIESDYPVTQPAFLEEIGSGWTSRSWFATQNKMSTRLRSWSTPGAVGGKKAGQPTSTTGGSAYHLRPPKSRTRDKHDQRKGEDQAATSELVQEDGMLVSPATALSLTFSVSSINSSISAESRPKVVLSRHSSFSIHSPRTYRDTLTSKTKRDHTPPKRSRSLSDSSLAFEGDYKVTDFLNLFASKVSQNAHHTELKCPRQRSNDKFEDYMHDGPPENVQSIGSRSSSGSTCLTPDGTLESGDNLISEANSDVIRRIPKPELPIGVFDGEPSLLSREEQQLIMKWRYKWDKFVPYPSWLIEPDIERIKDTVRPYLTTLGCGNSGMAKAKSSYFVQASPLIPTTKPKAMLQQQKLSDTSLTYQYPSFMLSIRR